MTDWYKVAIDTRRQIYAWTLQDRFQRIFLQSGEPPEAAMYARSGRTDQPIEMFFSPKACAIARALILAMGGVPCAQPPNEGTTLLIYRRGSPDPLFGLPCLADQWDGSRAYARSRS